MTNNDKTAKGTTADMIAAGLSKPVRAGDDPASGVQGASSATGKRVTREEKLAAALRANLRRRKQS